MHSTRMMIEQRKRRKGKIIILLNKLLKGIFGKGRVAFHGKKMKKLAGAFYGRLKAFDDAVASLPDRSALSEMIGRTVLEERGEGDAEALTAYVFGARESLASQSLDVLLQGEAQWPNP